MRIILYYTSSMERACGYRAGGTGDDSAGGIGGDTTSGSGGPGGCTILFGIMYFLFD